jgi:hypothetical protein
MNEFEFLAVLLSIVFGLALTQVLSGGIRLLYDHPIDDEKLAWALVLVTALVVNWWGFFRWSNYEAWTFSTYAFLMLWATSHFALATSLFPDTVGAEIDSSRAYRIFLIVFIGAILLDVAEGVLRKDVFATPLYLPIMAHWALLLFYRLLAAPRPAVSRGIAWYIFVTMLAWSFLARRLLPG